MLAGGGGTRCRPARAEPGTQRRPAASVRGHEASGRHTGTMVRSAGNKRSPVRRGRGLGRLHARARPGRHRPVRRADWAVRVHQLRVGVPDAARAGAGHRVHPAAQPVPAVLPGQDRLRGRARRRLPAGGFPGHHHPAVAHLRPDLGAARRRMDSARADAGRQAGHRARRRDLAVDADPSRRLRPGVRAAAGPLADPGRGDSHHLRRRADLEPDRRSPGRRARGDRPAGARALRRDRGRRSGVGRQPAGRQVALDDLRQRQGAQPGAGLAGRDPVRARGPRDRGLVPGRSGPAGHRRPPGRGDGQARGRLGSGVISAADGVLALASDLADGVLFPDAMRVDRLDVLPAAHLDALAEAGLYGAPAPADAGGLGLDLVQVANVVEELASGCLAVTFVLIQHFRLVMTLAEGTPAGLRDRWLASACQGRTRGGIALTGLIPGPPQLRAEPAEGGWRLDGTAPWVTGWGLIDLVQVVARGPDDTVVTLIMDAAAQPGLTVTRQHLVAVDAAVTVRLGFDGVVIPPGRFVDQVPFDPAATLQPAGLRINGSLALGLARRCCRMLGPGPLDDEVTTCRARLDAALEAGPGPMADARAAASELALRAAAALAVRDGSRAVTVDQHAQRLAREAVFLLVFGSRPRIKSALLERLGAVPSGPA